MNMDYCLSELKALLSIDSPSGFTDKAADYLIGELTALGYAPERTRKGGVFCCLGGEGSPLVLMAHVDTLGGMISTIKPNGRITITPIGGLRAETAKRRTAAFTRASPAFTAAPCSFAMRRST